MPGTSLVQAAIFDMDGLLIDSEPLWLQAEIDIFSSLGVDTTQRDKLPDTVGLRIDQVVSLWYETLPWEGPDQAEVAQRIIERALTLIDQQRPLLPGVRQALMLCRQQKLAVGLASASPLHMLEHVLAIFDLRHYFDVVVSAESLPYSKPHPQVYLNAASELNISPRHCVTLEDSVNGMIATKSARMRSIVIPEANAASDRRWSLADVQLTSLLQLKPEHLAIF